ncbi:MAG TPA: glycoside hydrolase family 5 protein [Burkholderiales bacterium]|nr:glycoside hydrolase family 5 protein [Burkholderiales bacterium]
MIQIARALITATWLALIAAGPAAAEITPHAQVKAMGRGVNILGYDPIWRDPAQARFRLRHLVQIKQGGFDTVRINLHAFEHMDAEYRLDPAWLITLDKIVAAALGQKLTVILDLHNFTYCGEKADDCKPRLMAFWQQIGQRYKNSGDGVVFEILNEPNGQLNESVWNSWLVEALALIRKSNPTRNVIIGPALWNNIERLDALELPKADRHIIGTVHYYQPMEFTHQGVPWSTSWPKVGVTWGTPQDRLRMKKDFALAQRWAKAQDRPIVLGEFGAYDKGDIASRAAYTAAAAREAEALGWAWTYWQFDGDFIVFDMKTDNWVKPIYDALIPK